LSCAEIALFEDALVVIPKDSPRAEILALCRKTPPECGIHILRRAVSRLLKIISEPGDNYLRSKELSFILVRESFESLSTWSD
jgi:hypothetical protein